jgi:hypothetical protein
MEMTFQTFKRKYNVKLRDIRRMQKLGIIEIFQQGYRGHALCHDKKIRVKSPKRLELYFGFVKPEGPEFNDYEIKDACPGGYLTKDDIRRTQASKRLKQKPRKPKKREWLGMKDFTFYATW